MTRPTRLIPPIAAAALLAAAPALAQSLAQTGDDATLNVFGDVAPLNDAQTTNQGPHGEVRIATLGDRLEIAVYARGLEPGMHRVHVHGFTGDDPQAARCPTPAADINDDGWVDLAEARLVTGEALIPITTDTVSLTYDEDWYPEAGTWGVLDFETRVMTEELRTAVRERHGTPLALTRRVVLIHGVSPETELPVTVYAPQGSSAHAATPVACAMLIPETERPV
ncbi:hypothetical protein [Salinarimonas sp.]|uniref:hypothetical protein n=1 Tax=Salinarimonas sp. TaxID=2766526 RepID=UPI0032D97697